MQVVKDTLGFFIDDYRSHPVRWIVEALAWSGTLVNSILISATVPDIPWMICYPIWILGCIGYAWAQWTRRASLGMFSCLVFAAIDGVGFAKVLLLA